MDATQMQATPSQGLEGIVVATTELSSVNGQIGELILRGYYAQDLAGVHSFEEVAYLLWHGSLPAAAERQALHAQMAHERPLSSEVLTLIHLLAPRLSPMDLLRTATSALVMDDPHPDDDSAEADLHRAVRLTACLPTIIAASWRISQGQQPVAADPVLSHAANFLYMLRGSPPHASEVHALHSYLTLLSDHGMNASTFTARVIASTRSDMISAITGAIGALKGPLHGGAPGPVLEMLQSIGSPDRAADWVRHELAAGRRIMGIGHRVYKVRDPRAAVLSQVAEEMARAGIGAELLALARQVEDSAVAVLNEEKPGRRLYANVEFYTAVVLNALQIPPALFSPVFAASRVAGWTAHVLEQTRHNRLIRPESVYTGPRP